MQVILQPPPDLQVTNIQIPEHATTGQTLNLEYTVTNKGVGDTPTDQSQWRDLIYLPRDQFLDSCTLQEFGHSSKQKHFEFHKTQVLEVFRNFLDEFMGKAVDGGYITSEEKEQFLLPMPQQAMR